MAGHVSPIHAYLEAFPQGRYRSAVNDELTSKKMACVPKLAEYYRSQGNDTAIAELVGSNRPVGRSARMRLVRHITRALKQEDFSSARQLVGDELAMTPWGKVQLKRIEKTEADYSEAYQGPNLPVFDDCDNLKDELAHCTWNAEDYISDTEIKRRQRLSRCRPAV